MVDDISNYYSVECNFVTTLGDQILLLLVSLSTSSSHEIFVGTCLGDYKLIV